MRPKEVLYQFIDAFNAADAELLGEAFFHSEFAQAKMFALLRIFSKTGNGQLWNGAIRWD